MIGTDAGLGQGLGVGASNITQYGSLDQLNQFRAELGLPPLSPRELQDIIRSGGDPLGRYMGASPPIVDALGPGSFNYGSGYTPVPGSATFPGTGEEDGSETGDQGGSLGEDVGPQVPSVGTFFFGQAPTGAQGQFTTDDILVTSSEQPNMYDAVFTQEFAPLNPYATPAPALDVPAPRETPNLVYETQAPTPVEGLPAPPPPIQVVPDPVALDPIVPEPQPPVGPNPVPTPPPMIPAPVPSPVDPRPVPPPVETNPVPPPFIPPVTPEPPPVELAPPKPLPEEPKDPVPEVAEQAPPTFSELLQNYTRQTQASTREGQAVTQAFQEVAFNKASTPEEVNAARTAFEEGRARVDASSDAARRSFAEGIMGLSPEERARRLDNPKIAGILGKYYDPETKGIVGLAMGGSVNMARGPAEGIEAFLAPFRDPEAQMQERRNAAFMRNMRMAQQPQMPQGPQPTAPGTMQQGIMPIARQRRYG